MVHEESEGVVIELVGRGVDGLPGVYIECVKTIITEADDPSAIGRGVTSDTY